MTTDPAVTARLLRERVATSPLWISASGPSMGVAWGDESSLRLDVPTRPPRIGEVWVFVGRGGELVAHRFLRWTSARQLVFRGDHAERSDRPIREAWLVGRVIAVDDGSRTWIPRRRHAAWPLIRAVGRSGSRRVRTVVHGRSR